MFIGRFLERVRDKLYDKLSNRKIKTKDGSYILLKNPYIWGGHLSIGMDVYIGPNATILCGKDKVTIEDHVVIGPNVTLCESNHVFNDLNNYIKDSGLTGGGVIIESDCWLGANVTVLAGVTIGKGSVIGACSCVTRSIPPYSIAVGTPAKVIKRRFSDQEIIKYENNINKT